MFYDTFDNGFGMMPSFDSGFGSPMFNGTGCFPAPADICPADGQSWFR